MEIDRRKILTALAGLGLGAGAPSAATLQVPVVDWLQVQVLVDSNPTAFGEAIRRPDLLVEPPQAFAALDARLLGEWGLSLVARSRREQEARNVLFDFGYSPEVFGNNARLLGLERDQIDAAVLSHGHYDHFGGLAAVLAGGALRPGAPFHVGGEEAFCERQRGRPGAPPLPFGTLDRGAIEASGLKIQSAETPTVVASHGFVTGSIPLRSVERPAMPSRMLPGRGCRTEALAPGKRGEALADDGQHELGLAYHVRDRGLVVLGSCSHRGVLNTILQAQAVSGVNRLHAVMGGFHLVAPRTPQDAEATAQALVAMNPDYVIPGHCSGETFIRAATTIMGEKVIRPYVGARFTFGSAA